MAACAAKATTDKAMTTIHRYHPVRVLTSAAAGYSCPRTSPREERTRSLRRRRNADVLQRPTTRRRGLRRHVDRTPVHTAWRGRSLCPFAAAAPFLGKPAAGPFTGFYNSIAGSVVADVLFMAALLGIGVALLLGIGMRIAAAAGALLTGLMWTAVLPPETNPFMDDHLIYAAVLVVLALLGAGNTWGPRPHVGGDAAGAPQRPAHVGQLGGHDPPHAGGSCPPRQVNPDGGDACRGHLRSWAAMSPTGASSAKVRSGLNCSADQLRLVDTIGPSAHGGRAPLRNGARDSATRGAGELRHLAAGVLEAGRADDLYHPGGDRAGVQHRVQLAARLGDVAARPEHHLPVARAEAADQPNTGHATRLQPPHADAHGRPHAAIRVRAVADHPADDRRHRLASFDA